MGIMEVMIPLCLLLLWMPSCLTVRHMAVAREEGIRPGSYFYHVEDGYYYHFSDQGEDAVYFKCVRYPRCHGRAKWSRAEGFEHTNPHAQNRVCRRDMFYAAERDLKRRILRRCRNLEYVSFTAIVREESRRFPIQVRSRVTPNGMRTSMRNARMAMYPNPPPSLRRLTLILRNPQYGVITISRDGEDNLYAGSVTDALGNHHVIFSSNRLLQAMRQFVVLHTDGTFKVVPAGMGISQVFCIVGVWQNRVIPLSWTLMETRSLEAYTAVMTYHRHLIGDDAELTRLIMDFEAAEMRAGEEIFQCRVTGCMWHLIRRFLSYAADRGLIRPMRLIEPVRRIVHLTMAVPLLPENLISTGFLLVVREAIREGNYIYAMVRPYLQDIQRIWIRSARQRRRICVHGSAQRTNNACESHNRMLRNLLTPHPNIFIFIEALLTLEQQSWDDMYRLNLGRNVGRARRRTSIMNDQAIINLSQQLVNPPGPVNAAIMRFLTQARHTMDGVFNEALL